MNSVYHKNWMVMHFWTGFFIKKTHSVYDQTQGSGAVFFLLMNNFIESEFCDFLRTMTTYPNQPPMITANYLAMLLMSTKQWLKL
jgi:hypothetical protein